MTPTKLRRLLRSHDETPFFRKVNVWDILDRTVVGLDLQMSAVLELSALPDVLLKGSEEIESHLGGVRRLLQSLPEDVTLQWVVKARMGDPERVREFINLERGLSGESFSQKILGAKAAYLHEKFILRRRYYLHITTYPGSVVESPSIRLFSAKEIDARSLTRDLHLRRLAKLESAVSGTLDALRALRVEARRLEDEELSEYFFAHLSPTASEVVEAPKPRMAQAKHLSLRSLLCRSAAQNDYDRFRIDDYEYQGVNLLLLPESVNVGSLPTMMDSLWPDYDLALSIHSVNSDTLLERLKRSANISRSLSFSHFGSRYEATQKFEELDALIREIGATTQRLYTASLSLLFRDKDKERLEENVAAGLRSFHQLGAATGLVEHLSHEDLFLSSLPNHSQLNLRRHVLHTEPLSELLALTAPWKGTASPKMLFECLSGELVSLDLFDSSLPAKHGLVIGTTGSGKSFTTNYLLTNFYIESEQNHIVIIDVGGSYRKLCQLFGGQYLNVELSEKFGINPFPAKRQIFDGKEYDADELAYLTLILERMVLDQNEAMNSLGETIIEKALKAAYEKVASGEAPTLSDVRQALGESRGDTETVQLAQHYFKNLEMWTEGRYSKVFNSRRGLEINNRLIVFDLEQLGNHPRLQSVYFYVIREIIDSKLRDAGLRKIIVIDEGHKFFDDDIGSRLIDNLYRTARKRNAAILSISQSPVDFLKTKAATGIITNSYVKYILRLTKGHDLLPQFGLSASEIEAIRRLHSVPRKYSDLFLKFNETGTVLRLEASPLDYWICTTDPQDSVRENEVRKAHPEWSDAEVLLALAEAGRGEKQARSL